MRIAVLYSGHLRSWDRVKQNQIKNIAAGHEVDYYFYTYEEPKKTEFKQFVKVPGTWYDQPLTIYDSNKNPITCTDNTLQAWHNLFVGFCLVPQGYDVYVKSRCDIELSGKIDFKQYDINDKNIYIPHGNDHCDGVNDQFAFGSYEVMKKYYSIYLEHQNLFIKGKTFHTEYYVTENLKAKGVNIVRLPITNIIIRQNDQTAFSDDARRITSENPEVHWSMLSVKGKIVLDLGCGRMWDLRPTTPEYFLNSGASKVVGVEMWDPERIWYLENVPDPRLTVITDQIDSVEKLKNHIRQVNPQVIKCDIEGQERLLAEFSAADFASVDEMAIEYHNDKRRQMIEDKYKQWGFNHIAGYTMDGFDYNHQGVLYLKK